MKRLTVRGKYLYDGERKFFARGVSYGPFTPNSRGERYPEPSRTDADFALMRDMGVNLVRTYVPPPHWMFELASKHELRMMVGMPWPFHMAFLDSPEMMADIRKTIGDGVRTMRAFADVIFAYSLGNEIRSDIVRWHGPRAVNQFLRELYDVGKDNDPDGLFTFSNYPSAEYLDLNFLDVVSFNVYLHREGDFRRYLTHLLATTEDRPLVLSETGMDTIREGEAHQAELLEWQVRAAFELGLSGFIVFAFTDEWHTGGAEITDWAFGLVTRDRQPKIAFNTIAEVFKSELPPPLPNLPRASVVVCAYNADATIDACLESLKHLNYPDYEVLVIDDGSTDATARIAETSGARVVTIAHRGLSAARNAGIAAAAARIVAFIDADAEADRDWLYHLAETITRQDAIAVGGQNFPPVPASAMEAAIAAAPGEPREVRAGDDELDQVCGCSMALDKTKLPEATPFDELFTTAGDDVDFSWSLRERGFKLVYAPGAIVIHRRRATIAAYLRQQIGYGRGEAILARKYPNRVGAGRGVYGGGGWIARWFGAGERVYYGAFGRGLFQSLYRGADFPFALQIPLNFFWISLSAVFAVFFLFLGEIFSLAAPPDPGVHILYRMAIVGLFGLSISAGCAFAWASNARLPQKYSGRGIRALLALLSILGPFVRSFGRQNERDRARRAKPNKLLLQRARFQMSGELKLPIRSTGPSDLDSLIPQLTDAMRTALLKRDATVFITDGYQPYDMMVRRGLGVTAILNFLKVSDGELILGWKLKFWSWAVLLLLVGGVAFLAGVLFFPFEASTVSLAAPTFLLLTWFFTTARTIPPLLELAAEDAAAAMMRGGQPIIADAS
jgi:cellulose synthase/poly-beta-1,6-N-acetylglucosamine synthase-like glycosyltransferase